MKSRVLLAAVLIGSAAMLALGGNKTENRPLTDRYKTWLEEEVVYIIVPGEKEVFLKLVTDRERDLFIEAFWKQRDPTPGTEENEFRREHYRRINHANRYFGRGQPKPGWMTDRGRMYIILGEPSDIQRFEGKTQVYPTEVWFYQGKNNLGLPTGFNLVFFQESGVGEYRLYSPLADGPQALLTSYLGDPVDYLAAYEYLREFEADLAEVSLTLIPGERSLVSGRPTMTSDILIQRVEQVPIKQVEERYARKFLEYKDIVEVEYTANYMDSDSLVKVVKDPSGMYFVHYAIEPARLSVGQYENKYYTTLKLNGTVSGLEGRTVYQFEKDIPLEFDGDQIKQISQKPLSLRDMFPLIPGRYNLRILVKNESSKEFTSMERELLIPDEDDKIQMTSLILGYEAKREALAEGRLRPFQIGPYRLQIHSNRTFMTRDEIAVVFQLNGLSPEQKQEAELGFVLYKEDQEFSRLVRKVEEYPDLPLILQTFSCADLVPAHYRLSVELVLDGRTIVADKEDFDITHSTAVIRPWTYSKILASPDNPVYAYVLGTQFFNTSNLAKARTAFEQAYRASPETPEFALGLARTLSALDEFTPVESLLKPFVDRSQTLEYEFYYLLGRAYQKREEWSKAVQVFDLSIKLQGLNTTSLNALGECHERLGDRAKALAAWEKSLEINQDQPEIKTRVDILKERR